MKKSRLSELKKVLKLILCIVILSSLVACSNNAKNDNKSVISITNTNPANETKVAVVYFSATGNTEEVAKAIAEETKADVFEIVPEQEYSKEDLDYSNDKCRANQEMEDEASRPSIKNDLSKVTEYDEIYLGYPIWWGTCPKIVQTFLEEYNISNSKIHAFCTSGGSGIEGSISDLQTLYPNLNIINGKRFDSVTNETIEEWIKE